MELTIIQLIIFAAGAIALKIHVDRVISRIKDSHDEELNKARCKGKNSGLAIAAATVQHIMNNTNDFEEAKLQFDELINKWVERDPISYEKQKEKINSLRGEQNGKMPRQPL